MLPFTREQFLATFVDYNTAVWPAQWAAYALALLMLLMLARPTGGTRAAIGAGLAAMWAWTGVGYHWLHFSAINQAALAFGGVFVLQALLLLEAAWRGRLAFAPTRGPLAVWGWALIGYAAIAYPLIGMWTGHSYPELPMFGITPCPLTLFTFGLLSLTLAPVPRWLLAIPLLWSLIGGSAAALLGIAQDWPLLFSGVITVTLMLVHDRAGRRLAAA